MPAPNGVCEIIFWYQLECTKPNLCNISVLTKTMNGLWNMIKTFTYPWVSNSWKKASFSVKKDEPYLLIFEGSLDKKKMSSLNIDDIIFSPGCIKPQNESMISSLTRPSTASPEANLTGECSLNEFKCNNSTSCVDLSYLCDGVKDCRDGSDESVASCDKFTFLDLEGESPLVHFEQLKKDQLDWLLWDTSEEFPIGHSIIRHSLRRSNGKFLLAVGSENTIPSDKASVMYLPVFTTKDSCVVSGNTNRRFTILLV